MISFAKSAFKIIGCTATGLRFLVARPTELPQNLWLGMRYVWHVRVRRRELVALVREGGIGDFVCLLASIPGLRERHKNSWLVVICPPACKELADSSGLADATGLSDAFLHRLMRRVCSASRLYQPTLPDERRPPQGQRLHLADEFALQLGVAAASSAVTFEAPGSARRRVAARLRNVNPEMRPIVAMHTGPSWRVREWPIEYWNELASLISHRTQALVVKIGTDIDSFQRPRPSTPIIGAIDWTNTLDMMETVALLERTSVFLGIDSGPLHIACALRTPCVGLFGAVSGSLRIPPWAKAIIARSRVDCLGCHHSPAGPTHWRSGCRNDVACMKALMPSEVFEHVVELLAASAVLKVA